MLPLLRRFLTNTTTRRYAQVHDVQIKYVKEVASTGNEAKTMTEKNGKHIGLQRVSSRNVGVCDPCILHCDAISLSPSAREAGGIICLCPAGLSVTFSSHSKKHKKS